MTLASAETKSSIVKLEKNQYIIAKPVGSWFYPTEIGMKKNTFNPTGRVKYKQHSFSVDKKFYSLPVLAENDPMSVVRNKKLRGTDGMNITDSAKIQSREILYLVSTEPIPSSLPKWKPEDFPIDYDSLKVLYLSSFYFQPFIKKVNEDFANRDNLDQGFDDWLNGKLIKIEKDGSAIAKITLDFAKGNPPVESISEDVLLEATSGEGILGQIRFKEYEEQAEFLNKQFGIMLPLEEKEQEYEPED